MALQEAVISAIVSALLTGVTALYMVYLRVPAVMKVRPKLKHVDLVTGMLSGRGGPYLWYHYTTEMTIVIFIIFFIAGLVGLLLAE